MGKHPSIAVKASPQRPVCVIVVNWNGWRDTVVCLQSLFRLKGHPLWIVVCDNGSSDGSSGHLAEWLSRELGLASVDASESAMRAISFEPADDGRTDRVLSVQVVDLPANFGYAGAINRGIAWGQKKFDAKRFWLLNNDVQAEPDALDCLVAAKEAVSGAGLCGSVLLEWDRPDEIQAIGGVFRKSLGMAWHLRELPTVPSALPGVCLHVDYPVGASLYVEKDYLDNVGLMDDSYFLYGEEMDWVERGRRRGYRPVVALGSRLFHREGASTGSHGGVRRISLLSERYSVINRLRITLKFWPTYLPIVWLSLWAVVLDRLIHGEQARAALVLRLMFSPKLWLRKKDA